MGNKDELEIKKLELEKRKLELEIELSRRDEARKTVVSISVVVGLLVSVFGVWTTLSEIDNRNRALAMEASIRTHELVATQVLERAAGYRIETVSLDGEGEIIGSKKEQYPAATVIGTFALYASLAQQFPELKPVAIEVLTYMCTDRGNTHVLPFLRKLGVENEPTCE